MRAQGIEDGPSAAGEDFAAAPELGDLASKLAAIPLDWDDWELDEDLRQAGRLTQDSLANAAADSFTVPNPALSATGALRRRKSRRSETRPKPFLGQAVAWLFLSLGLMAFVCGAVLVGWSYFSDRHELWRLGMPLTLVGQAGWLAGVLLQIETLWQNHRDAASILDELDERLDDLEHAASLVSAAHSQGNQSFYAHLADGASPGLLLADLKGQLDLLAMQLQRQRAA